ALAQGLHQAVRGRAVARHHQPLVLFVIGSHEPRSSAARISRTEPGRHPRVNCVSRATRPRGAARGPAARGVFMNSRDTGVSFVRWTREDLSRNIRLTADDESYGGREAAVRRIIGVSLIGLGAFLVAAGVLVRFYAAPVLIGAPVDIYQVTRLRAEGASYLDASSLTVRSGATVVATSTVRGDVKASDGDTAVWDNGTVLQDMATGTTIEVQNARYAFDRRTARLKNCCGAAVQDDTGVRMSGIGLFWP